MRWRRTRTTFALLGFALVALAGNGWAQGFVVIAGDDADEAAGTHCTGTACGGLFKNLFNKAFQYSNIKTNRILAIGVNSSEVLTAFNNWNFLGPVGVVTHARTTAEIAGAVFSDYQLVYIPSSSNQTSGGINATQIAALNARQPDLAHYVNNLGGALIALTQAGAAGAWGWLPVPLTTLNATFGLADVTPALQALSPTTTSSNLSHDFFHNVFTGPPGFSGLGVLAVRRGTSDPVYLGGPGTILRSEICNDGLDNDNDGLIDENDPDCHVCGDGNLDPNETCDDGNKLSGDGCSETCQTENRPPNAQCANVTVLADPSTCLAGASIDAGSFDPDGDPVTLAQFSPGPYGPGATLVLLTVTDDKGASATCPAMVTVVDDSPPALTCPAPFVVECTGPEGASVGFQASASDNCACSGVAASCAPSPGSVFPLGSTPLTCSATDASGNASSCSSSVTVVDTGAPSVDLVTASPAVLWSPDHMMVSVTVAVSISDVCDPNVGSSCTIVSVESNEPENGLGDGDTAPDWQITGRLTVDLRAERGGIGTGRIYTITTECRDASGNLATRSVQVTVPHNP